MSPCGLRALRGAMEGVAASLLCTCDAEGQPNVSMISQVYWVDDDHVALSWQFFNKTRTNLLATGKACVEIFDPLTHARHRLHLDHVETRTEGPLFEMMKSRLAGIASHHGLEGVFRLLGADVFRVAGIEQLTAPAVPAEQPARPLLSAARSCIEDLARCRDFDELADRVLDGVVRHLHIEHTILLMAEGDGRLFAIGSRGYAASGVGAEILRGEGVIGVAAREAVPIRIGHLSADYRYGAALGAAARQAGLIAGEPHGVPFPGLGDPHSQIAVPILSAGRVLGVLFCESPEIMRFDHEDEDALVLLASYFGAQASLLGEEEAGSPDGPTPSPAASPAAPASCVTVRRYPRDDSLFLDDDYLIKGVAGAILWRLLRQNAETGRTEFSTRELRLDRSLKLPDHAENLDARLVLLRRRLEERGACLRIERSGRGRFRLVATCGIALMDMDHEGSPAA
ncbi:GAF domain-containing protein [Polymorphum gilvum]|uniref:Putative phosphoenolpyruvate-protein phosphotransferase n=1 Tax=Polymorphum gilvum (strain LMG 25793 / CGMCC 1.9160 / SL003B-26A1) TaxID=991905 RepID=F2J3I3_POLGS|nr:GAF domain-containing protein [Polymorphum gilvum]ADZ71008.1 Putative phosphoenolpyruvate-protein phosphotransferase [Polymorphum gilvum SL003B-26A1]